MIDYKVLKQEITKEGYVSAFMSGQDWKLADILNETRPEVKVMREFVNNYEIFECIDPLEWTRLDSPEKERITLILSMAQINIKGDNTRNALRASFPEGTITWNNISTIIYRDGSRAEELFGPGTVITWDDIARARKEK